MKLFRSLVEDLYSQQICAKMQNSSFHLNSVSNEMVL